MRLMQATCGVEAKAVQTPRLLISSGAAVSQGVALFWIAPGTTAISCSLTGAMMV